MSRDVPACPMDTLEPPMIYHGKNTVWISRKKIQWFSRIKTGWWFGCHGFWIVPLILGCCHHPNWRTPSFFRGVQTPNHQSVIDIYIYICFSSENRRTKCLQRELPTGLLARVLCRVGLPALAPRLAPRWVETWGAKQWPFKRATWVALICRVNGRVNIDVIAGSIYLRIFDFWTCFFG